MSQWVYELGSEWVGERKKVEVIRVHGDQVTTEKQRRL